jgi:hypothetical protein
MQYVLGQQSARHHVGFGWRADGEEPLDQTGRETTATSAKTRLVRYAVKVASEANYDRSSARGISFARLLAVGDAVQFGCNTRRGI